MSARKIAKPTPFASTMGSERISDPYSVHNASPDANVTSILKESPSALRTRYVLITCGTFPAVVRIPAMKPIAAVAST
jgi:hypothetical protein